MKTANIYNRILVGCCVAVALAWLWGCGEGRSARLRAIDAIMEDDPALALAQLDSVDAATLSDADYPYYCLLYTQAQVKNNIVLNDDSLIAVAYEAYANSSDDDLRRRANFYNAKVAYYAKDYRTAMRDILPAYEIAKEQNDPYWTAKAAEIIGDIYFNLYNYSTAEGYTREAAMKYKEAGKELNHRYALSDLNATLMNEGKEEEALRLIDSLHTVVKSEVPLDKGLYGYVKMSLYSFYVKTGRMKEFHDLIDQGMDDNLSDRTKMDLEIVISNALNNEGKEADATIYLTNASNIAPSENDRARVLYASFKQSLQNKDFAKAAPLGDTLIYMQSNLMRDVINESVTGVQSDFYQINADKNKREVRTLFWIIVGVSVFMIIVIVLIIINHKLKMKVKDSRLETILESMLSYELSARETEAENSRLEIKLKDQVDKVSELNEKLSDMTLAYDFIGQNDMESLVLRQCQTLNFLCDELLKKWDNEKDRSKIRTKLLKEIRTQTSPSRMSELQQTVKNAMTGIISLLRTEVPTLTEDDLNLLTLIFAGLNHKSICLILKITPENYYKKRSRLKQRIEKSSAPHRDIFLSKFNKNSK